MGTAGLDVKSLAGLLQRIKVDCALIEGDESQDHCVLRLLSVKHQGRVAFVEYVNRGVEPRLAGIKMEPPEPEGTGEIGAAFWMTEEWIKLRGARSDDPQKIAEMVKQVFSVK
jgi:hypothetical protein